MLKKLITFTNRMYEMVEEIQSARGYPSFSAVIHASIIELHGKTFPAYKGVSSRNEDPATKVRRKMAEKDAKLDVLREEKLTIVSALEGTVVSETGGKEFCQYYTYTSRKRFAQKVPLHLLSAELVKAQYQPSKERVLSLQKAKKVDY